MFYVSPQRWPLALALYAAGGVVVGLMLPGLRALAANAGVKPGVGVAVAINLLLPLVMVLVTCYYPRVRTAWPGAFLLLLSFVFVALLWGQPRFWLWNFGFIKSMTSPIEVAAIFGCGLIGTLVALVVGTFRRVGLPDAAIRCACGYLLPGLPETRCPECGRTFDSSKLDGPAQA